MMSRRLSANVSHAFISILALASISAAAPIRYKDDISANTVRMAEAQHYSTTRDYAGVLQNLHLDLYEAQGDTAKARPLIIWVHGGGFSSGTKDDADVVELCRRFARKGYVTASIDYRLDSESRITDADAMNGAVYRAVQDAKSAVRFLRAHEPIYRIDPSRILMGGTSAGGVISLLYAYLDQSEVPEAVDLLGLGSLESSGVALDVSSRINGIINCWGGVADSTWLDNGKLPVLSFHGTLDATMPYDKGHALGNPDLVTVGSACIHRVLTRAGVHSILKPFEGMGHGIPPGDARADTLADMTRDFAWYVLFGGGASALKAGKKSGPVRNPAASMEPRRVRANGEILNPRSHPRQPYFWDERRLPGD